MNKHRFDLAAAAASGLALALFLINLCFIVINARLEREVIDRSSVIARGENLQALTKNIAGHLNEIGNRYGDRRLCDMLRAESMPVSGECDKSDQGGHKETSGDAATQ